jgi:hypothetical protein
VTGRDINLFGPAMLGVGAAPNAELHLLTHCPCAFADLEANRNGRGKVHARLVAKGAPTAEQLRSLGAAGLHAPTVAIVTAGRSGLGSAVCAALREMPLLAMVGGCHYRVRWLLDSRRRALIGQVYVSCCEHKMRSDVAELMAGAAGFAIADGARFDSFPGTSHTAGALLLLRRPAALVLPVGPAGSGKSTLARELASSFPPGSVHCIDRDHEIAVALGDGAAAPHTVPGDGSLNGEAAPPHPTATRGMNAARRYVRRIVETKPAACPICNHIL